MPKLNSSHAKFYISISNQAILHLSRGIHQHKSTGHTALAGKTSTTSTFFWSMIISIILKMFILVQHLNIKQVLQYVKQKRMWQFNKKIFVCAVYCLIKQHLIWAFKNLFTNLLKITMCGVWIPNLL